MKQRYLRVGNRTYSHQSVLRLVEQNRQISSDPQEIIQSLIRDKLKEARQSGWTGPPFDPRILASIMGIRCEESRDLVHSEDAELHPTTDEKLVIKYNPNKPLTRQNFSIAHEISHTFFPDFNDRRQTRHRIGQFDPTDEVEFLCDLGASEIILPFPEFHLDVKQSGISLESFEELRTLYETSREATAIRMVSTDLYSCAVAILDYSHKPSELSRMEADEQQLDLFNGDSSAPAPPMKLRVQFCIPSKQFSIFIPPHKSIEESSPIHAVSLTEEAFRGKAHLDFGSRTLPLYVEAMAIPGSNPFQPGSRVLAFLLEQEMEVTPQELIL